MASTQGDPAVARSAPELDGASSAWENPWVSDGVMSAIDARDNMAGLIREAETGVAPPSAGPFWEEPLTTQTASSSNPGASSVVLPIFNHGCASTFPEELSSCLSSDQDDHQSPEPEHRRHPDCLSLFYTFYLSPSVSRSKSSAAFSSTNSSHSRDTLRVMPGPILDVPAERQFLSPNTTDYFSPVHDPAGTGSDSAQLPPRASSSRRSERTQSPMTFARWTKRHQQGNLDDHAPKDDQQPHKLKRREQTKSSPKRPGRSRSSSVRKRHSQAGVVAQMTREQFEALPLAIRRKYFSTLERLRFAQESGLVDGISQHYDDISNFRHEKPRQDRNPPKHSAGRTRCGSGLRSHSSSSDSSPFSPTLPEATRAQGSPRESNVALGVRHRASVILDAADEAVYKLNQQASRRNLSTAVDLLTPPLSPTRNSMESQGGCGKLGDRSSNGHVPQSFYESFRWLDEEEDLDLRLFLDDYHANLRDGQPTTKQRPSFRRHLSITKIPFGRRSSISSPRPGTTDATGPTSPINSPAGSVSNGRTHARRKSRAMSLMGPRHAALPSVVAFDPAAAHYQDPEARLKLRVYLASPQKFDEAVEFGFPAVDALSPAPGVGQDRAKPADGSSNLRTFLADEDEDADNLSLDSDQPSLADPESPKTPEPFDHKAVGVRHARLGSAGVPRDLGRKSPEGGLYAQIPAASREMTLRMTLTRPDLRAHEDQIYGWQHRQATYLHHSRRPTAMASQITEAGAAYPGRDEFQKGSLDKFPEMDHWHTTTTDKGMIRRIWNRVRRA